MTLDKLPLGKAATIEAVGGEGALRRHFLNMGLTPGTRVTLRKTTPMGDPIELELRGYFRVKDPLETVEARFPGSEILASGGEVAFITPKMPLRRLEEAAAALQLCAKMCVLG